MAEQCPHCLASNSLSDSRKLIVSAGFFCRASDGSKHQRYRCRKCGKSFSDASFHPCYRQRKRYLCPLIFVDFASGASMRRLARKFDVNRKTIVRKFIFLGKNAEFYLELYRQSKPPVGSFEFDDLETFEHSKLKPLSVTMAVEAKTRRILGFKVASMPAKGLLVAKSLKKYGPRKDERKQKRRELFAEIQALVAPNAIIKSDENPHYGADVREFFPGCKHKTYKSRRGCVVGQGELKGGGFDPIFSLNHSFAMLRANINRLFRRTWNTTKKAERLHLHIAIYVLYHNLALIQ